MSSRSYSGHRSDKKSGTSKNIVISKIKSDNLRFDSKRSRSIRTCLKLLVYIIVLKQHFVARGVNGQQNSSSSSPSSTTLPSLSERAGGLNSRYLSASGTASLAAATVAAAASNQQSSSVSPTTTTASSTSALQSSQDASRNFLIHQQQQQQQQSQQQSLQVNNNNGPAGQQQQQVSPGINQQQQLTQYTLAQPVQHQSTQQQITGNNNGNNIGPTQNPPTLSTRYSYNPSTGQYVPLDSFATSGSNANTVNAVVSSSAPSSSSSPPPSQQQQQQLSQSVFNNGLGTQFSNTPFVTATTPVANVFSSSSITKQNSFLANNPNANNVYSDARGQQIFQPSQLLQVSAPPPNQRPPIQHITLGNHPYSPYSHWQRVPAFVGSIYGSPSTGAANQYSRRNGLIGAAQPNRVGSVFNGGGVDDDSNGLFTQSAQQQYIFEQQPNDANVYGGLPGSGSGYFVSTNQQQPNSGFQQDSQQQVSAQQSLIQKLPASFSVDGSTTGVFNDYSVRSNNDQCVAADNRHGTCYQASECIRRGGTPMGKCGGGATGSSGLANLLDNSGSSHVCCLFDITCGQFATERFVYFRNPNYPSTYDQSRMCRAKIGKLDKGICQFRLDLLRFDVAKPTNGNCSTDMFVVSGQNENYVIPKICGFNDGQHYYVGVDESGVITLHMMMMGYYRRSFEILITQIPCRSDFAAPAHCLQNFIGTHGTVKSFNYDDEQLFGQPQTSYDYLQQQQQQDTNALVAGNPNIGPTAPYGLQFNGGTNLQQRQLLHRFGTNNNAAGYSSDQFGGYPNDMDYTICIRKESGFCSITYQLSRGEQGPQPFAIGQSGGWLNETGSQSTTNQWFPVSTECRDDYLLIGGVKLCSSGSGQNYNPFYDSNGNIVAQNNNSSIPINGFGQQQQQQQQQQQSTIRLQQNLQNQYNQLLQQLARMQQQQQFIGATSGPSTGNVTYASNNNNHQAQQNNLLGVGLDNNNNLEQQQAAIMQQLLFTQQQLSMIANNNNVGNAGNSRLGIPDVSYPSVQSTDWQNTIITDTTSGPFLLRFVSNMARNARGFHIDYRQNPCK